MILDLAVTLPGRKPADVSVELGEWSSAEVEQIISLCEGPAPLAELARGEWNPLAARAMLYVKLSEELAIRGIEFAWEDMDFDVGELEPFLSDPELIEIEETLPMEQL